MRGVSRTFDGRPVVRGIDLTVPRGTILGIIGPSGAGKTTTIRMLTGALDPDRAARSASWAREPRRFRRRDRERIGYMPQLFTLYEDLTAGENVDFVASLFGMLVAPAAPARPRGPRRSSTSGSAAAGRPGSCRAACSAASSSPAPSSTSRP